MKKIILCWIGLTDIEAAKKDATTLTGPIVNALEKKKFDRMVLLSNFPRSETDTYIKWVVSKFRKPIELIEKKISSPTKAYFNIVDTKILTF